jgi:flagellar hook-basal body complex protein FliE
MPDRIEGVAPRPNGPESVEPVRPEGISRPKGPAEPGKAFGDFLKDALGEVNKMQVEAEHAVEDLASGKTEDIARVMLAVAKADLAFETMMQIRNKLLDAYQEMMRMNT